MAYLYHNQKNRNNLEELLQELKESFEGKNLSVRRITGDEDGCYSEEKLLSF